MTSRLLNGRGALISNVGAGVLFGTLACLYRRLGAAHGWSVGIALALVSSLHYTPHV